MITNSREVHGPIVAEHVIALIFALAKKIPQAVLTQEKGVWGQQAISEKILVCAKSPGRPWD